MDETLTYTTSDTTHILIGGGQWVVFCGEEIDPGDVSVRSANCPGCIEEFAKASASRADWQKAW